MAAQGLVGLFGRSIAKKVVAVPELKLPERAFFASAELKADLMHSHFLGR
jgi:hypothetical protein